MKVFCEKIYETAVPHLYKGFKIGLVEGKKSHYELEFEVGAAGSTIKSGIRSYNPYAFYSLYEDTLKRISNYWEPKNKKTNFGKHRHLWSKWYFKKNYKYYCRMFHKEWQDMLLHMDPHKLRVAKALFAANFGAKTRAGVPILEDIGDVNPWLQQEIIDYVPAAMLAHHKPHIFIAKPTEIVVKPEYDEDDDEYYEQEDLESDNFFDLDGERFEDGLSDWRGFYGGDSKYLDDTLRGVKPGLPFYVLEKLKNVHLERPLLSKQEVVVSSYASSERDLIRRADFCISGKKDIIDAVHKMNASNDKRSCRKSEDLESLVRLLHRVENPSGTQRVNILADNYTSKYPNTKIKALSLPF